MANLKGILRCFVLSLRVKINTINFFFLLQYYCGILNNITLLGAKGKIKGGYFMVVFLYSP